MFGALLRSLISVTGQSKKNPPFALFLYSWTKIKNSLCQIVGRQVLRFEVTGGVVATPLLVAIECYTRGVMTSVQNPRCFTQIIAYVLTFSASYLSTSKKGAPRNVFK